MKQLYVNSMVAARDRSPWVVLRVGGEATQLEPKKAREIAGWLLECAEAAESDSFIVSFMQDRAGLELGQAVGILAEFRKKRGNTEHTDITPAVGEEQG